MAIQPVFDPAIPVEVRDELAGLGDQLPSYSGALLIRALPGWRRQAARDAVRAVGLGAVCALLPAVLAFTRMFGWAAKMVVLAAQIILLAVWFTSPRSDVLWAAVIVSGTVQVLSMVAAFLWMDAWQLRRGVRQARGRYLVQSDFGPESREFLARPQAAIAAGTGSPVASAGLVDVAANDVVLARQEWEIARGLAREPARAARTLGWAGMRGWAGAGGASCPAGRSAGTLRRAGPRGGRRAGGAARGRAGADRISGVGGTPRHRCHPGGPGCGRRAGRGEPGAPAAAAQAETLITIIAGPEALRAVTEGRGGVAAGAHRSLTVIELSTAGPSAAIRLAAVLPSGTGLLDAPVLGSLGRGRSRVADHLRRGG